MQSFEYRSVRYWSKEINGTLTGGQKFFFFLIREIDDATMAGASEDSSANVAGGAFREARGYVPGPLLSNIWARRTTRMYSEFRLFF